MFFRKKLDRALKYQQEQNVDPKDLKEQQPIDLEKHDMLAMMLSALGIILPVALIALLAMALIAYLFLGLF